MIADGINGRVVISGREIHFYPDLDEVDARDLEAWAREVAELPGVWRLFADGDWIKGAMTRAGWSPADDDGDWTVWTIHGRVPGPPRFYIATGLPNAAAHAPVRAALEAVGHVLTYDWTEHGPVGDQGADRIRDVSVAEAQGVAAADYLVVVLPGGRGTHTEMGMAMAQGKPVFILGDDADAVGATPATCAFYHHPAVAHASTDRQAVLDAVLARFPVQR